MCASVYTRMPHEYIPTVEKSLIKSYRFICIAYTVISHINVDVPPKYHKIIMYMVSNATGSWLSIESIDRFDISSELDQI